RRLHDVHRARHLVGGVAGGIAHVVGDDVGSHHAGVHSVATHHDVAGDVAVDVVGGGDAGNGAGVTEFQGHCGVTQQGDQRRCGVFAAVVDFEDLDAADDAHRHHRSDVEVQLTVGHLDDLRLGDGDVVTARLDVHVEVVVHQVALEFDIEQPISRPID